MPLDIITLGEALIDLPSTQSGVSLADVPGFAKVPAGAPANVAVAAARLGLQTAFLSKVGDDAFGECIIRTFAGLGVETSRVIKDKAARTGLAFVSVMPDGSRDFLFYFDPARDLALRPDELDPEWLASTRIFHYGSISLIAEPGRSATQEAARLARAGGAFCSYDPNLRPRLWPSEEAMRAGALAGFADADLVKISEDEVQTLMPDAPDEVTAVVRLFAHGPRLRLLCVTRGPNGCTGYHKEGTIRFALVHSPGFAVPFVDATGAGDAFVAGLLAFLLRQGPDLEGTLKYASQVLPDALRYANACGALATTTLGATPHDLTQDAITALLETKP